MQQRRQVHPRGGQAHLRPRSFADLRTGFALQCTQAGVPLQELASWLGVSLRTVEPLAAFTPHSDPARRIAAAFGGFE